MKRLLQKSMTSFYHYTGGEMVYGAPSGIEGDLTGIEGDLTGVRGDLTGIGGDLTGVRGNLAGVRGNLTGVMGDLDACEITEEERQMGIDINELVQGDV